MKSILKNSLFLLLILATANQIEAQRVKQSKFNIITFTGFGYGVIKNDKEPNYNLNGNGAQILFNYKLKENIGLGTGIGVNTLTGNGFNSFGNFYHERVLINIPLALTTNQKISDLFNIVANFGIYGQNIIKDNYRFLNTVKKNIYSGWSFGSQFRLGFTYKVSNFMKAGVNFSGQSDFTKFTSNKNQVIDDKQKIESLNTIGVMFIFDF